MGGPSAEDRQRAADAIQLLTRARSQNISLWVNFSRGEDRKPSRGTWIRPSLDQDGTFWTLGRGVMTEKAAIAWVPFDHAATISNLYRLTRHRPGRNVGPHRYLQQ